MEGTTPGEGGSLKGYLSLCTSCKAVIVSCIAKYSYTAPEVCAGELPDIFHGITGKLCFIDQFTVIIRNFYYDSTGPGTLYTTCTCTCRYTIYYMYMYIQVHYILHVHVYTGTLYTTCILYHIRFISHVMCLNVYNPTHTHTHTHTPHTHTCTHTHTHMLGVLCCFALFVCLTLLASFFLPSHLSLKHVHF